MSSSPSPLKRGAYPHLERFRGSRVAAAGLLAALLAVAGLLLGAGAAMADPGGSPAVVASPAKISVGGISVIAVTGLGDLTTARLGIAASSGATFKESGTNSYTAAVTGGSAHATVTATIGGIFTVVVSDGETVIAQTTVTAVVSPTSPAPKVTLSVTPSRLAAGKPASVVASGLSDATQATFVLQDAGTGAAFIATGNNTMTVSVINGSAQAAFETQSGGQVTISVRNGQTVLASAPLTVTAAQPPAPSQTPTPSVSPITASNTVPAWVFWTTIAVAVVLVAALATACAVIARRRRPIRTDG